METNFGNQVEAVDGLAKAYTALKNEIGKVIVGQDDVVRGPRLN